MRIAAWLLVGLVALLEAPSLHAQSEPRNIVLPKFRGCGKPAMPIGKIKGSGRVSVVITSAGKPDLASLQVIDAVGISTAGLKSAAERYLPACTYAPARQDGQVAPARIIQSLSWRTGEEVGWLSVTPVDGDSAQIVEEFPASVRLCYPAPGMERMPRHFLALSFVIDTTGSVDYDSITVLKDVGRVGDAAIIKNWLTTCRYAPGRIEGRPLSVRVSALYM
jgi:hypothetical protein